MQLKIVYCDDYLVAADKPSGLLVHRTKIDSGERRFAVQTLRDQLGRRVYPLHRLDKGTSGVLLFAFDSATARLAASAFAGRRVRKTYLAVVRGWPDQSGEIDHPLEPVYDRILGQLGGPARPALTAYRRLATVELPYRVDRYPSSRYALMELAPRTGRRHQLRRHLAHDAHPIIGDSTYGKGRHNRLFRELFGIDRLLLACTGIDLAHPVSGEQLELRARPAPEMLDLLDRLGWSQAWPAAGA